MELTAQKSPSIATLPRRLSSRIEPGALAAWTLGFSLVSYLALSNGGADTIVRSQVGVAVWWIVLLGALAGVLPARIGTPGWAAIGLLSAFAAWTGLAVGWSESAERSVLELGRVAMYVGVLCLAIAAQGRAAARHTIKGLACAIGLVTLLAVLARLQPEVLPASEELTLLAKSGAQALGYPLNDASALAVFAALGAPLLLAVAIGARTLAGQAAAAAALPVCALCVYLTGARGGWVALVAGLVVFVALSPPRRDTIATLLPAAAGSAILITAAAQRDALHEAVRTATASSQGTELLWLVLIVCSGVALLQLALGLAARHLALADAPLPGVRWLRVVLGVFTALALAAIVAAGAGGLDGVGDRWQAALDAHASAPLTGTGPGTFEFWLARDGTLAGPDGDARSLYLQTLAETGFIGAAILAMLLLGLLGAAVVRSLRSPPRLRLWIAAAAGGLAAFMTAAALEGIWNVSAIVVVALALAAVVLCTRDAPSPADSDELTQRRLVPRAVLSLLAVVALGAVIVPMAAAMATRDSGAAAADGRLAAALEHTRTAERLQPYAVTPRLQAAGVLEASGKLDAAAASARAATVDEPTNWRTWAVLARIEARRGNSASAVSALREARHLNPRLLAR